MKKTQLLLVMSICFLSNFAWSQINVTGKVTSSDDNIPLPGASIVIKGTTQGTVTDFDGNYNINVLNGSTLIYSFIGFTTKEVVVGSEGELNVALDPGEQLDEVVVTAFGIQKKTKSLGYAVQKVDATELELAGTTNALEALQGRVSGLQINRTSGSVGGGVDILIRGVSSVSPGRDNQPLIIVDGIPLNNDTFAGNVLPSSGSNASGSSEQFAFSNRAGDINPEDVESYNVLKGAAATALYGIRASNGAIIITTKKGKQGKVKVGLNLSTSFREIVKTPDLQKTYREGHRTSGRPGAVANSAEPDGYDDYGFAFYSWGVPFTADSYVYDDGTIVNLPNDRYYDPYDLFKTGVNTQINFNLSGATEKMDYFLSAGRSNDQGVIPNTDYTKTNFRLKAGYQVTDNFKIDASVSYSNSGGNRSNGGDKSVFSSLSYWSATYDINDYQLADGSQKNYSKGFLDNPRYFAETSNLKDDVNRWVANTTLNWAPLSWLNITYTGQVDNYNELRNRFVPADLDTGSQVSGFIVDENINFTGLESNLFATMRKEINEDWTTSLTVGQQISDTKTNYAILKGEGLNIPGINEISNTTNLFGNNTVKQLRNMGIYGDWRLEYKDKIFLTITGRNDWISVMPPKNRSFFYPSVSASYVFTDLIDSEKSVFSFAKLRASWAQVGKGPNFGEVGHYFIRDSNFPFSGAGGYRSSTQEGDVDLIPERNNSSEIGLDLRFLNNRFRIDYSYYKNKVTDQIFPVGSSYSSGLSSIVRNAGDYETWGHELLVTADILQGEDFNWEATINWSTTGSELTAIPEDLEEILYFDDEITSKSKVGDALGTLYGWKFQTVNGQRYVDGDGKWVVTGSSNEGFYNSNGNEKVVVGNAFPNYVLSLSNTLKYKNLSFNFLVEYKSGGDVYDRGFRNSLRNGNLIETEFRDQNRVLEGLMDDGNGGFITNTQETLISANNFYRDANNYNFASEVLLEDASWIKLT